MMNNDLPYFPESSDLDTATTDQLRAWAAILVLEWEFKRLDTRMVELRGGGKWGYADFHYWTIPGKLGIEYEVPNFAHSMDAAEQLMRKLASKWADEPVARYGWAIVPIGAHIWSVALLDQGIKKVIAEGNSDFLATAITKTCIRYELQQAPVSREQSQAQVASLKTFLQESTRRAGLL